MLDIRDEHCRLGKISNNLEKNGEDGDEVTGFTIPITELQLGAEEINAFMEEPYADRWMFNTRARGTKEPVSEKIKPFALKEDFDDATITLTVSGDREIELQGCKVKDVTLEPMKGGAVHVNCRIYVRPGLGKENLLLQEHQNREVRITIADAKVATKKKSGQKDLDLEVESDDGGARASRSKGDDAPVAH